MGQLKVILPSMGEGIFEATITQWLVQEGATINEDDSLAEIATDKVDSEIPSPSDGVLSKILVPAGEIAKVGQEIAIISTSATEDVSTEKINTLELKVQVEPKKGEPEKVLNPTVEIEAGQPNIPHKLTNGKFLSPLVRAIASKEGLNLSELELILGTGLEGRITKEDLWKYLDSKKGQPQPTATKTVATPNESIEIVEMNRLRKLIAENMVNSKRTSPHVTSFHEVDVTKMVEWRETNKDRFQERYGQKLTYTPIFVDAVVKAIRKYPMINISVDGTKILVKRQINVGMATALPDGNLIVPVIHQADTLSLPGLAARVNDLANRARNKQLQPTEIQGSTFTITNVGTFGNLSGTPIINQPEVAILATGAIKKRPAVIETPQGDFIGIRHLMVLSLSYDHRVVDGSLGGMFLKQVADNLEAFHGASWL